MTDEPIRTEPHQIQAVPTGSTIIIPRNLGELLKGEHAIVCEEQPALGDNLVIVEAADRTKRTACVPWLEIVEVICQEETAGC